MSVPSKAIWLNPASMMGTSLASQNGSSVFRYTISMADSGKMDTSLPSAAA
jgi:hypothetical protein